MWKKDIQLFGIKYYIILYWAFKKFLNALVCEGFRLNRVVYLQFKTNTTVWKKVSYGSFRINCFTIFANVYHEVIEYFT